MPGSEKSTQVQVLESMLARKRYTYVGGNKYVKNLWQHRRGFAGGRRQDKVRGLRRGCLHLIIIITRPKPAYGWHGLAGLSGQDMDEGSTFWVFLTSHFAPAALSSELNQPGTINDDINPPGIMKTRPGAVKKT